MMTPVPGTVAMTVLFLALVASASKIEDDFGVQVNPTADTRLEGFVLSTLPDSLGFTSCLHKCEETPGCLSINFYRKEGRCELNSASGATQGGSLVATTGAFHMDLSPAQQFTASVTSEDVCPEDFVATNKSFGGVQCLSVCTLQYGPPTSMGSDARMLDLGDSQPPFLIPCLGAGWLLFQRRDGGNVNFYNNWASYRNGMGTVHNGSFWLGNERLRRMTQAGYTELRVDLWDWAGVTARADYAVFSIGTEAQSYVLTIGNYSGDAGDSLGDHNGALFSTSDRKNGGLGFCVDLYQVGWWYGPNRCFWSCLNGAWRNSQTATPVGGWPHGVVWEGFRGYSYSLRRTEMKLRRPQQ